nr:hypothetical protein [uncultured Flavobacterium sp.]
MKKIFFMAAFLFAALQASAQVMVNGKDIATETETFEVWAFKKPFSNKESLFMNYGQDDFKPHYYDHKSQAISNKDGKKFEKGEWLQLTKYLLSQGFEEKSSRDASIGDAKGRVVTFVKKKE